MRHASSPGVAFATEREGFEPSNEVSPVTRFPVAPVQPLRHLSGCASSKATGSDNLATSDTARGYPRGRANARNGVVPLLAMSSALSKSLGLIATFGGIGALVNAIVIFIAIQARGERQQNEDYTAGLRD